MQCMNCNITLPENKKFVRLGSRVYCDECNEISEAFAHGRIDEEEYWDKLVKVTRKNQGMRE